MADGLCECGCGEPAPLAQRTDKRHGWVRGQPLRFINGHNRRRTPNDYVVNEDGCWIWQRAISNVGYGLTSFEGRTRTAHRVYYERKWGEIPPGVHLDHLCGVRACVNPDHLQPVAHAVNIQRGRGAKLTEGMVRKIRASSLSSRQLAAELGVSHRTVNDVRSGLRWSNVV
jgi:hypothetical protein